ncbi:MAG: cytidylate kinase-like family protein, partial [Oscillospiraceae bacterium]|nr:cytidylate kinase-like family protein [Oscillospiraceae bacterium]
MSTPYVVTIARGFGSGGKEIGAKLAQRMGIPVYERQILRLASDESGLNEALFGMVDEKL